MQTIDKENIERLKKVLNEKWNITADHWFPIDEYDINEEVVYFPQSYFFKDFGLEKLKTLISEINEGAIYQWNWEVINEEFYKIQIYEMVEFNNLEKFYFDENCNWIVYISHENTIAIGGQYLIEKLTQNWGNWFKYLNKWEEN
ncbi:MAG: hypothetical protein ACK44B_06660 [Flavobacteriales bacterium]|jgi:hypothetical protein